MLLLPTISLVIGATKRVRWLMLPYLVLFGIAQIFIMASILACVLYLPVEAKPLAAGVTAFEVSESLILHILFKDSRTERFVQRPS